MVTLFFDFDNDKTKWFLILLNVILNVIYKIVVINLLINFTESYH